MSLDLDKLRATFFEEAKERMTRLVNKSKNAFIVGQGKQVSICRL